MSTILLPERTWWFGPPEGHLPCGKESGNSFLAKGSGGFYDGYDPSIAAANPYPGQLYNLATDIGESNNLYAEYPQKVEELTEAWKKNRRKYHCRCHDEKSCPLILTFYLTSINMESTTTTTHYPKGRLLSLDLFRGMTMFLLIAEAAHVYHNLGDLAGDTGLDAWIVMQFHHHPWNGLRFWDLIQPFFMFIVGVAMPFSLRKSHEKGSDLATSFPPYPANAVFCSSSLGRACTAFTVGNWFGNCGMF